MTQTLEPVEATNPVFTRILRFPYGIAAIISAVVTVISLAVTLVLFVVHLFFAVDCVDSNTRCKDYGTYQNTAHWDQIAGQVFTFFLLATVVLILVFVMARIIRRVRKI